MEINNIIKSEDVGYLKSAINLQQGTLIMTKDRLTLTAHKTAANSLGFLGALLKKYVENETVIFDLLYTEISVINNGKHGMQNNVAEIKDYKNNTYRLIVKNYQEWEEAILKHI